MPLTLTPGPVLRRLARGAIIGSLSGWGSSSGSA